MRYEIRNKKELIWYLIERDGIKCSICGKYMSSEYEDLHRYYTRNPSEKAHMKRSKININVDHYIPFVISKDGTLSNLRLSHITCNFEKGDKIPKIQGPKELEFIKKAPRSFIERIFKILTV